ncbi:MAG: phosphoribosylglycinamide formyltransferase [Candidatus Gracilibacteria bacterium]|nr:phosphoribosylglycinamide formyltransferase [Candidatus Gracilibacteria bacterium]
MKICVFASTNGTDLGAILEEIHKERLPGVELTFVLVNKECGAAEKARNAGISVILVDPKDENGKKKDREVYDREIHAVCEEYGVELVVLVGWMRILSPWFVQQFPKSILNIHPSLLPKYPGMDLNVHAEVIKNGEKESGMTIHYVDEGVDSGEVILQKSVEVVKGETPESLKAKVQKLEKAHYPAVILQIAQERSE